VEADPSSQTSARDATGAGRFSCAVKLPSFEGPLDLLLHLCRANEVDIADIPIALISEQYLAYLELMRMLDIDVAADYLLMAATLAHIKSRLLLPPDPDLLAEEGLEDPRAELARRDGTTAGNGALGPVHAKGMPAWLSKGPPSRRKAQP